MQPPSNTELQNFKNNTGYNNYHECVYESTEFQVEVLERKRAPKKSNKSLLVSNAYNICK